MATTVTQLALLNTNSNPKTTGSLTPTAGSLLLCSVGANNVADPLFSGTLGGTWTRLGPVGANPVTIGNYYTLWACTNYNASGVLTVTGGGSWVTIAVVQVVDAALKVATPTKQVKRRFSEAEGLGTSATPTLTFDTVPTNASLMFMTHSGGAVTPGSGWTELYDDTAWSSHYCEYKVTGGDGTADVTMGAGLSNYGMLGVEIDVTASASKANPRAFGWRR